MTYSHISGRNSQNLLLHFPSVFIFVFTFVFICCLAFISLVQIVFLVFITLHCTEFSWVGTTHVSIHCKLHKSSKFVLFSFFARLQRRNVEKALDKPKRCDRPPRDLWWIVSDRRRRLAEAFWHYWLQKSFRHSAVNAPVCFWAAAATRCVCFAFVHCLLG